jgi:mono/diheme cytochrome c family protein
MRSRKVPSFEFLVSSCPTRNSQPETRNWLLFAVPVLAAVLLPGCRQDMQDQPKYKDLRGSAFFADGRSARPLVEDTVARGFLYADQKFATGRSGNEFVKELPVPLTKQLLERGRERFNIYCTPCHGMTGDGLGMVVQRGYRQPPSFHIDRLREAPVGYFFDVMTRGFGAMPDYAAQITPADRWAIAAYERALQLSQRATIQDVPAADRPALDRETGNAPPLPAETDDWKPAFEGSGPGDAPLKKDQTPAPKEHHP